MIAQVCSTPSLTWLPLRAASGGDSDRFQASAQNEFTPPTRAQMLKAAFPQTWEGRWKGEMSVTGVPGTDRVGVELEIRPAPNGRHSWSLRYEGQPERPYEMVPVDPARGHYVVDEHNGILLDSYYQDGVLLSQFEVGQNRVTARYELEGDRLSLEMNMFGKDAVRESASGQRVLAFGLGSLQRAVLTRG